MGFDVIAGVVAVVAGAVASVVGFGIGSLLTPTFGLQVQLKLAVAAVSIPHFIGTSVRFWRFRRHVDRRVLWSFGIMSAAGGLIGALLHNFATSPALTAVFAGLLVFAGRGGPDRLGSPGPAARKNCLDCRGLIGRVWRPGGKPGRIRSAAMLGIDVPRDAFVATATAIALLVDIARVPVYIIAQGKQIAGLWPLVAVAIVGVVIGTLLGERFLHRIPEAIFRRVVSVVILALGLYEFYVFAKG